MRPLAPVVIQYSGRNRRDPIANVTPEGRAIPGDNQSFALAGFVRAMGEADDSMNRLAQQSGYLEKVWSAVK
ncbi:uncharacterized protein SETTUDRAFT_96582 [Exserohilum turcica Et28A]|uniref:Uncharacterized protein n=1 Tax=Exserohilum turcicum (strain 28A) TaxID=671987 RepID=R0ICJ8_EXST2|nr:uncharacterized protein SETTUDRAFT_96582 [Exserohilum turcica Et28A]EOA82926.1 hypothetical protein SETTUDRAFT_96582 [Exserohilum turcica Et28A]